MGDPLHHLCEVQTACYERFCALKPPELWLDLRRATEPKAIRAALMDEGPTLDFRQHPTFREPSPMRLREEAAGSGVLDATPHDLEVRRLYPALDFGVYCASHAMGKPSVAWLPAIEEHLEQLPSWGIGAWQRGRWASVLDEFRDVIRELVGAPDGDVAHFENFSDAFCAVLNGLPAGDLVTTAAHFTTARYIHGAWAEKTGGTVVEVPVDGRGCVPDEHLIDALSEDTAIVSISHAFWRNGWLQDLDVLTEAMMDVCPSAVLLLDAYQTLGTVPVSAGRLPLRTAILGGGIKQLRAGTGAGFAWLSDGLLADLRSDRTGWWAHADPLSFSPVFVPGPGAVRFRTGVPSLVPCVALIAELRVLASSGDGDLGSAVKRARLVTSNAVEEAVRHAREHGLAVEGPETPDRRAAFFGVRVKNGEALVEALADDGVTVDYRPDTPGADMGLLRLSANHASFAYELRYAVDRILARQSP